MTQEAPDFCTDFDPTAAAFIRDPRAVYREVRERCPVPHGSRYGGFHLLTRYDDVHRAAMDVGTFSSAGSISFPPIGAPVPMLPMECDPPEHDVYRQVLQPLFGRKVIAAMEDDVRRVVSQHVDAFVRRGEADLVAELASPVPVVMIAHVLGLPEADWQRFKEWVHTMSMAAVNEDRATQQEYGAIIFGYLGDQLAARRGAPGKDVLSAIANADAHGRPLTAEEQLGMAFLLIVAGHSTAVRALSSSLLRLAQEPEERQRLAADRSLIPSFCDEVLRWQAPVQTLGRIVARQTEVRGTVLEPGDRVQLVWGSANHDEEVFARPDEFLPDREPNKHLSFGWGIHRCLGEHLGRLEMRIVVEEILDRIPDLEADPAYQPNWLPAINLSRDLEALPVRFTPQP